MDNVTFARSSLEKAETYAKDPFIYFVVLWIGLNALYAAYSSTGRESDKLKLLLNKNKQVVYEVRSRHMSGLQNLFGFVSSEPQHQNLREYIRTRKSVIDPKNSSTAVVNDLAAILNRIRNNMFHAAKQWDSDKEARLLEQVNPILRDLLKRLVESSE